jgi:hypothetical protein
MTTRSSAQVGLVGGGGFLHLLPKSISSGAQYVTLHSTNGWKKFNTCRFDSAKWFWLSKIMEVAVAGISLRSAVHLQNKV